MMKIRFAYLLQTYPRPRHRWYSLGSYQRLSILTL